MRTMLGILICFIGASGPMLNDPLASYASGLLVGISITLVIVYVK